MAVTCKIVSNGVNVFPELPIARGFILVQQEQRMLNGTLRIANRATKVTFAYGRSNLTETERGEWFTAHPLGGSFSHTDERGTVRTVIVRDISDELEKTVPAVPGSASTTGPGYYRVDVSLEQV